MSGPGGRLTSYRMATAGSFALPAFGQAEASPEFSQDTPICWPVVPELVYHEGSVPGESAPFNDFSLQAKSHYVLDPESTRHARPQSGDMSCVTETCY